MCAYCKEHLGEAQPKLVKLKRHYFSDMKEDMYIVSYFPDKDVYLTRATGSVEIAKEDILSEYNF